MDPKALIESYVDDVARRLPRRQRNDVGFELRALLNEELDGLAADAGRPADEAMALSLIRGFGRPQDVADRYRPAGFVIIRPADAPGFALVALIGVAVQWAISFPAIVIKAGDAWPGQLTHWWLTWGLGAFWWPGFIVVMTLIGAWFGRGRDEAETWTPPRSLDRDRVNRPGLAAGLAFWIAGAAVVSALPWLALFLPGAPAPLLAAFAFEPDFLRWRAPWVPVLWIASFALYTAVLIHGRWRATTRRLDDALNLAWVALLGWLLAAGPIFQASAANDTTRGALFVILLIVLVQIALRLHRHRSRIRPPAGLAA